MSNPTIATKINNLIRARVAERSMTDAPVQRATTQPKPVQPPAPKGTKC